MLFGYRSSLGSTLLTLQDLVSNPGRNSCFYCGKEKPGGREEGKQECRRLRQITKSPPMPLILHPLQSDITEYQSLSLPPSSLLLSIATTHRMARIVRSIHMPEPELAPNVPFLPFSEKHACTTDGEFLRHETWRERLTNWGMEGKERENSCG